MKKKSRSKKNIFLDMDGVLTDFVGAACKVHGRPDYQPSVHNFFKHEWGMSSREFWAKIDEVEDFWENLEKLPWADELLKFLYSNNYSYTILTSPCLDPKCTIQKINWMRKNIHKKFNDFFVGHQKFLLASENRLLIDDNEKNCELFSEFGGQCVLFPESMNRNKNVKDPLGYAIREIERFYSS